MRWPMIVATGLCLVQCLLAFSLDPADVSASSEEEHEFIHPAKGSLHCPKGSFLSIGGTECRLCSLCGPDLYVRHECAPRKDTVCDWCLNNNAVRNGDYENKCAELVRTHAELQKVIGDPKLDEDPMDSKSRSLEGLEESSEDDSDGGRRRYFVRINAYETPMRSGCWEKVEPILDAFFYLAIFCLLVTIVHHIYKRRQQTHREFVVTAPMLDDVDEKNIIRAAEHIKCKLGKKGYERLEEFI